MYISLWENYRGHPDNISFMQFSTKIDGFEQKDSQGFENSYYSYEQYPLEKFFIFTIYQNYTLALISTCTLRWLLNKPSCHICLDYRIEKTRKCPRFPVRNHPIRNLLSCQNPHTPLVVTSTIHTLTYFQVPGRVFVTSTLVTSKIECWVSIIIDVLKAIT